MVVGRKASRNLEEGKTTDGSLGSSNINVPKLKIYKTSKSSLLNMRSQINEIRVFDMALKVSLVYALFLLPVPS